MDEEQGQVNGSALPVDDVLKLKLKKPITLGNVTYEELTFREPTALELRKSAAGAESGTAQTVVLAQLCAGVPMRVIEQLSARDFARVSRFFGDLMTVDLETGPS